MCVFGRLSVTPLHCLVDLCSRPENYHFIPGGVPIISRESIMKLACLPGRRADRVQVRRNRAFEVERPLYDRGAKREYRIGF